MLSDKERAVMIIDTFQRITDLAGQVETLANHFAAIRSECAEVAENYLEEVWTYDKGLDGAMRDGAMKAAEEIAQAIRTAQPAKDGALLDGNYKHEGWEK